MVAIDGPSGSGKSTLARQLAERLNLLHVDTGAMFRALGLACHRRGLSFRDDKSMRDFLHEVDFRYTPREGILVEVDGEDYSSAIREHQVSKWASTISLIPSVRLYLLEYQRKLPQKFVCVMEGRDIGSVVFPGAFCKLFVTASVEVRAQRRYEQLCQQGINSFRLESILRDVEERDRQDRDRVMAPLRKSSDAREIDTSHLDLSQALEETLCFVRKKALQWGVKLSSSSGEQEERRQ